MTRAILIEGPEGLDEDKIKETAADVTVEHSGDDFLTLWVTQHGKEWGTPGLELAPSQARSIAADLIRVADAVEESASPREDTPK